MNTKILGFYSGYMDKVAGDGLWDTLGEGAGWTADKALMMALLAPVVLGMTGGAIHSKTTSPGTKFDVEQKELLAREMEEALADMKRRRNMDRLKETIGNAGRKPERSLHI